MPDLNNDFLPVNLSGSGSGTPLEVQISQDTPGTTNYVESRFSVRRGSSTLHRSGITAVDKLAVPSSPTVADVTTGGSLLANTAYNCTLAAANKWGPTTCPAVGTVTTANDASNTHVARVTTTAVTGATHYDLFLSTAANPLWVARITEAQRAAGVTITAVGTVDPTSPGANLVDIRVVGTGVASNAAPFNVNNAYNFSGITPVSLVGFNQFIFTFKMTVTDLRSLPTLAIAIFEVNASVAGDYHFILASTPTLLSARTPLLLRGSASVNGNSGVIALVDTLSGQGASVDIYVEGA
jgi:hypothetical protein